MNAKMKIVLSSLRQCITALRIDYRERTAGLTGREIRRANVAQISQARLSFLVPLYEALNAMAQQSGTFCLKGEQLYTKKFEALLALIRKGRFYDFAPDREKYFGDGLEELELPVPVAGVPAEQWSTAQIGELLEQVHQAVEAERQAEVRRGLNAEDARKAFLRSLSAEQLVLLANAIQLSRGGHAISLDKRDLGPK